MIKTVQLAKGLVLDTILSQLSLQCGSLPCEPSSVIQSIFKQRAVVTDDREIAKKVLIPTEEVNIWLKHLETVSNNHKKVHN